MIIGSVVKREYVENGIYEKIRLELVALGLLPDITIYTTKETFKIALDALRTTLAGQGKDIVDVVNVQTTEGRDAMELNKFYINYKGKQSSGSKNAKLSLEETTDDETPKEDKRFARFKVQPPEDLSYEIRWKTNSNNNDKVMEEILSRILGQSTYIESFTNEGTVQGEFLIECNGVVDMSDGRHFDKLGRFIAKDIITTEPVLTKANIKPMVITSEIEEVTEFPDDL